MQLEKCCNEKNYSRLWIVGVKMNMLQIVIHLQEKKGLSEDPA
jgi:hypothetical protein